MTAGTVGGPASAAGISPRGELDTLIDDAERALATVRRELDDAWEAAIRGIGVGILATAVALFAADLLLGLPPADGGFPLWASEALRLIPAVVLLLLGARYLLGARAYRERQVRGARWWRRLLGREPIPDSRLADLIDRERSMREEVGSLDSTVVMSSIVFVLVGLGLVLLVLVASTDVARGIGPLPGLGAATLGVAAVVTVGLVLGSGRRHLRRARAASARISEWDRRLLGIEAQFSEWR